MKFFFTIALLSFISLLSFSQGGTWTWMKGDSILYPSAVWGTQGIGDPANTPAPKYSYYHWQDTAGNFWVYSGASFDSIIWSGYDDLWKFDVVAQNWIWVRGSTTLNPPAVFGTQGIPSPDNTPGHRYLGGTSWTGKDGRFWLFSGFTDNAYSDDMWMYDPSTNEWTWMSGSQNNTVAHYGTMQVSSPDNTPAFVGECNASWVDDDGNLWFFGGQLPTLVSQQSLLWKYDVNSLEWTWMNGDTLPDELPVYGTLGVSSPANTPGARWCHASWKDNEGNFCLFGGSRYDFVQQVDGRYNDVWKYSPATNEWTWASGDSGINKQDNEGTNCETNSAYHPLARMENRGCAKDSCGNIWMFGGFENTNYGRMDDLWVYRPEQNDWSFIAGDLIPNQPSVFGVKGIPDPSNKPGGRGGAVTWFDHDGNLWLFGGLTFVYLNDLWRFTPDSDCPGSSCIPMGTIVNENNSSPNFSVYPNPSSGIINIEIPSVENPAIEIRNVLGQLVFSSLERNYSSNFSEGVQDKKQIDLSNQPSGIYFLSMQNDDKQWVKKIIIE